MDNKILVDVYVPEVGKYFNIMIPTNEYLHVVVKLICNIIKDNMGFNDFPKRQYYLMNLENLKIYDLKTIVCDTDIKNSTRLFLV